MRALIGKIAANVGGAVLASTAGLISTMVMARWMQVEAFGFVMILVIAFNAIAALDGLRPVVVYEAASGEKAQGVLLWAALSIGMAIGLLVTISTWILVSMLASDRLEWYGITLFSLALGSYFLMSVYWGMLDAAGRTAFTGVTRSVAWTVAFAIFALLAVLGFPLDAYAVVFGGINLGLLAIFWNEARRLTAQPVGSRVRHDVFVMVRRLLRRSADSLSFNLSALVMGSLDRVALTIGAGVGAVGLYSGAYELATKPAALFRVIALVLFPEAARSKVGDAEMAFVWARATACAFGLVSVGVGLVVAGRDWMLELLLGSKFVAAADAFGVLLIGFSLVVLGYCCAVILNARGDFVLQRNCYGWTAAAMALLAWPLTRFGILGAAALYSLSRLVDVVLMYFTARKVGALSTRPTMLMTLLFHAGLMLSAWYEEYVLALACSLGLAWMLRRWVLGLRCQMFA